MTTDSNSVVPITDRFTPEAVSAKVATYKVSVNEYQPDSGVEPLLMLGLPYNDSRSVYSRVDWIYQKNPAGQAIVCIVEHAASHKQIGLLALCQRQIWTRDGLVSAGIFCDLITDKAHRTLGPAILLMQEAILAANQLGLDRVYGWPNEKSIVLFKRFPTAELGKIDIYRRYFNWSTMFATKLPRVPALLLGGIVESLDVFFGAANQFILNRFFFTKHLEEFDSNCDELWSRSRERYDEIGIRDAQFLNWRFGPNSDCDHKIFSLYSRKENKLAAYVVYRKLTEDCIEISDFLAADSQFTERAIMRAFCNQIRKSGICKISLLFSGNKKTRNNLWASGFIPVGTRAVINFLSTTASAKKSDAYTHITQADHDVG